MANLSDLKVGDKVIVEDSGVYGHAVNFTTVTKVTKTQITTEGGTRYLKRNGRKVGELGWRGLRIHPATPENVQHAQECIDQQKARKQRDLLVNQIRSVRWDRLPIEKLEAIMQIAKDDPSLEP